MVEHGRGLAFVVLVGNYLVKYRLVARFLYISRDREYHPERIVVEIRAELMVAHFGERLILVISTAVFEHSRREIEHTLSCALGYLMNEAQQILVAVTEAHSSAYTALEIRSGTRHIERYHALVLIPDVYHSVYLLVGRINMILTEQVVPVGFELVKELVRFLGGIAHGDHLVSLCLVYDILL